MKQKLRLKANFDILEGFLSEPPIADLLLNPKMANRLLLLGILGFIYRIFVPKSVQDETISPVNNYYYFIHL